MAEYKTYQALITEMNKRTSIALKNVANIMANQLRYFVIEDFYNQYSPEYYERTFQLQDAPTFEMVSDFLAEVFLDTDTMTYKTATGQEVAELASKGYHGNENIFRAGYFWDDFIEWCDANVPNLLKQELQKVGFTIK